jgi:hypothetical protein
MQPCKVYLSVCWLPSLTGEEYAGPLLGLSICLSVFAHCEEGHAAVRGTGIFVQSPGLESCTGHPSFLLLLSTALQHNGAACKGVPHEDRVGGRVDADAGPAKALAHGGHHVLLGCLGAVGG